MPLGQHIANCLHCGRQWVVGDCIPSICPKCLDAGHENVWLFDCPKCQEPMIRIRAARLAAEEAAEAIAAAEAAAIKAKADEEAEFSEGILWWETEP